MFNMFRGYTNTYYPLKEMSETNVIQKSRTLFLTFLIKNS